MDVRRCSPSEPKERNDVERTADAGQWQAAKVFVLGPGGAARFGAGQEAIVPDEDPAGEEAAECDC